MIFKMVIRPRGMFIDCSIDTKFGKHLYFIRIDLTKNHITKIIPELQLLRLRPKCGLTFYGVWMMHYSPTWHHNIYLFWHSCSKMGAI